jgi:hypothetical protein
MAAALSGGIWAAGTTQRTNRPDTTAATATPSVPSGKRAGSPHRASETMLHGTSMTCPSSRRTISPEGAMVRATGVGGTVPANSMLAPDSTRPVAARSGGTLTAEA